MPSPRRTTVFILNRYRYQEKGVEYVAELRRVFPCLNVQFMTAHSSKGLEADYVVVDNLRCGRHGFPTEITDDPVLSLVLPQPDAYEHGEERRLFYVALTRSRNRVFLIADVSKPSCFVREILTDETYEKIVAFRGVGHPEACPSCGGGWLVRRNGRYGTFFPCSNSPLCSYKEEACPGCGKGRARREAGLATRCEACGLEGRVCPGCRKGLLVRRQGPYGEFYGCTLYNAELNSCRHTEEIG